MRADAAHQRHDGALHGFVVGGALGQQHGLAGDVGTDFGQAREHAVEPALALVVGGFQRQRGPVEAQRQQVQAPGAQQRGLAIAGRPLQHDAAPPARLGQLRQQPFARDHARGAAQRWRAGWRRGQRGGLAAGWRRRVGWRVGHRSGGIGQPGQADASGGAGGSQAPGCPALAGQGAAVAAIVWQKPQPGDRGLAPPRCQPGGAQRPRPIPLPIPLCLFRCLFGGGAAGLDHARDHRLGGVELAPELGRAVADRLHGQCVQASPRRCSSSA